METDKNISYVGTLQELGRPYSMLFVDKVNRQLYILVRISENADNKYLMSAVSPAEVEAYMEESLSLLDILKDKSFRFATVENDAVMLGKDNHNKFIPTERMKLMNIFDPDLCADDVWIEIFLNRINNNQPLEIA